MKFILYFHIYAISYGDSLSTYPITTIMAIYKDSVIFYVYDLQYVKWKMEEVIKENIYHPDKRYTGGYVAKKSKLEAIYRISYKDIIGFITINSPKVEIRILTDNKPILIQLKE